MPSSLFSISVSLSKSVSFFFNKWCWISTCKKKKKSESTHRPYTTHKNHFKIDHSHKCKIVKFLRDNIRENLGDLGFGDDFLETTLKAWFMKEVIDKLNLKKIFYWSIADLWFALVSGVGLLLNGEAQKCSSSEPELIIFIPSHLWPLNLIPTWSCYLTFFSPIFFNKRKGFRFFCCLQKAS